MHEEQSTHRCCAERRLLAAWERQARQHGVAAHAITVWVRRKVGPHISVWRFQKSGTLACATPCVFCARELRRFDMRVHCSQGDNEWFSGRLEGPEAPEARPTSGQIRSMFRPQRLNQARGRRLMSSKPAPPPLPPPGAAGSADASGQPDWW